MKKATKYTILTDRLLSLERRNEVIRAFLDNMASHQYTGSLRVAVCSSSGCLVDEIDVNDVYPYTMLIRLLKRELTANKAFCETLQAKLDAADALLASN